MTSLTFQEKKQRYSGLAATIAFHVALLLLFLFMQLSYNKAVVDESDGGGILINFGDSETGLGDIEPMSKDISTPAPPQPQNTAPQKNEDLLTQDVEPSTSITTTKPVNKPKADNVKTKPSNTTVVAPPVEKPKVQPKLYPGNTNNSSTSQGNTSGTGNQGKQNGSPYTNGQSDIGGGDNPLGKGGAGSGITLNLAGRSIKTPPTITDNSQKTGKVKVNIKVDKNGNVVSAKATQLGSTTEDSYLYNLAEKAAFQTKFNSSDNTEQFGSMTFTFKVK